MQAVATNLPCERDVCLRDGVVDLGGVGACHQYEQIGQHDNERTASPAHLGLPHKESHAGAVTVSIGLAINNPRGPYDKRFFHIALHALKKAQRKGLGGVETIDLRPAQERRRKKIA
ncbi:MAG: hypothetical protein MO846_11165 [Candidatus Devosia symbiotica]|nr:hypothetical protein [Candidatus Devosia symbiotica]